MLLYYKISMETDVSEGYTTLGIPEFRILENQNAISWHTSCYFKSISNE